jgi:hypothetical protein
MSLGRAAPGIALAATLLLCACGEKTPARSYAPGLGEIMTFTQMRHAKLWLAGSAGNWNLAAYEASELEEGFHDAAEFAPADESSVPIAKLVPAMTNGPLAALRAAIEKKNARAFAKAFDSLTAGCNACHQATQHGFNVITRPKGNAFLNQDFAPARKATR